MFAPHDQNWACFDHCVLKDSTLSAAFAQAVIALGSGIEAGPEPAPNGGFGQEFTRGRPKQRLVARSGARSLPIVAGPRKLALLGPNQISVFANFAQNTFWLDYCEEGNYSWAGATVFGRKNASLVSPGSLNPPDRKTTDPNASNANCWKWTRTTARFGSACSFADALL